MKKIMKKVLSVLMVLAILLVPMTVMAEEAVLGSYENPYQLSATSVRFYVYLQPEETAYVQVDDCNNSTVDVGYATGNYMIGYGRLPIMVNEDLTASFQMMQMGGDIFSVYNPGTEAVSVYMSLTPGTPVVGTWDSPEIIETTGAQSATVEESSTGYYYEWTAPSYGKVTIAMDDETGWQYQVNKAPSYGDLHAFDDDEVVASETMTVNAGETVAIMVNTYDPNNTWAAPAGTINWTFSFDAIASVLVDDATSYKGGEFDVAIKVENNPGIISMKLDAAYDSDVLEFVGVKEGDFTGCEYGPTTNVPFAINWVDGLSEENITTNGTFAVLTFKVKDDAALGDTPITVTYEAKNVFDKDFNDVEFEVVNGTVTIGHKLIAVDEVPATCSEAGVAAHDKCEICDAVFNWGFETTLEDLAIEPYHDRQYHEEVPATPKEKGTKAHYSCPTCDKLWVMDMETSEWVEVTAEDLVLELAFVYGDVNDNGEIDNVDLAELMQFINGWDVTINEAAADVLINDSIDNVDYARLMQYVNGWDVALGVTE